MVTTIEVPKGGEKLSRELERIIGSDLVGKVEFGKKEVMEEKLRSWISIGVGNTEDKALKSGTLEEGTRTVEEML